VPYRRPKREPQPIPPPKVEGEVISSGTRVSHHRHGEGVFQWAEWHDPEGAWVPPLDRDPEHGQWFGVVSLEFGSYMVPLTELRRA
jgi:hypothetical protein